MSRDPQSPALINARWASGGNRTLRPVEPPVPSYLQQIQEQVIFFFLFKCASKQQCTYKTINKPVQPHGAQRSSDTEDHVPLVAFLIFTFFRRLQIVISNMLIEKPIYVTSSNSLCMNMCVCVSWVGIILCQKCCCPLQGAGCMYMY